MSRTWLSIRVDLIGGGGQDLWPRPGRILAASRSHTFAQLATAIDDAFARLLAALGAPALVELTAYVALANLYSRTNTAFGIESQGLAASCELRPLAEPSGARR